jgi:O-antigen/teichoic acid export membrane protein
LATGIILLPINTLFLNPEDYGGLAVAALAGAFIQILGQLGLPSAVLQHYTQRRVVGDIEASHQVVSMGLVLLVLATSIVIVIAWLFTDWIAERILTIAWVGIIRINLLVFGMYNVRAVAMYLLQAEERAGAFLTLSLSELGLSIGLNLLMVVFLRLGVIGVAMAGLVTQALMLMLCVPILIVRLPRRWSWSLVDFRRLLRYGLPLVPGQMGMLLADRLDRSLLARLGSLHLVGIYDIGYRIGSLQDTIASAPLNNAWIPYLVNRAGKADIRSVQVRALAYFFAGSILLAVGLGAMAQPVLQIAVRNPAYWQGHPVVFIVALAYVFKGMNSVVGAPLLIQGRTEFNMLWWTVTATVNLGLNLVLIPWFGIAGAAWATLLAFLAALVMNFVIGARHYPVPYELSRLFRAAAAGIAVFLTTTQIAPENAWRMLFARFVVCVTLYPLLLWILGFVTPDEWSAIRRRLHATHRHWLAQVRT